MISTRVMDVKLRETTEGLGEDSTGKKKSKFKTFKKFFGKKKRKESPSTTGSSTWKQSQAKSEVIAIESGPVGYDSEDELEESRGAMGNRALSHDSIFIPESGQDPARPVRVFSQENVSDRIKALQLKIQCNVKIGPPPPLGGLPAKRGDDTGMSSEDDGLPRSPPEMSLLHDISSSTTIRVSLATSSSRSSRSLSPDQLFYRQMSEASISPRTSDSSMVPVADFDYPPEFSSCLDNSAAKHKLLVKPRNQRSSKMRRLSSRAQSESLSDLTCTPEEEECEEKPLPKISAEEKPNPDQHEGVLDRVPELKVPVSILQPGGARARRARLQHSPALNASTEEESTPTGDFPSCPESPGPVSDSVSCSESPSLPEDSSYPHTESKNETQRDELSMESTCAPAEDTADEVVSASGDVESGLSPCIPEGNITAPETELTTALETSSGPDGSEPSVQMEVELTVKVPILQGAGEASSEAPTQPPSPSVPKSCLKHKVEPPRVSLSVSSTQPASEDPEEESSPCPLDKKITPTEFPKAEQEDPPQGEPEKVTPKQKRESGGGDLQGMKKFSVSSGRMWSRTGSALPPEHAKPTGPSTVRLPLLRSNLAWKSEAALDDLQVLPECPDRKLDTQKPPTPAECDSQDLEDNLAGLPGSGKSPQDATAIPVTGEPCPVAQESPLCEDIPPFPVKLRSTSLSFKHRDTSSPETRALKRYSAEIRLEKGGLTLLSKDEKGSMGTTSASRGARSPNDQRKGKTRPSEPLRCKPPLPRKPLLQTLTLPHLPTPPDSDPGELEKVITPLDLRKESKNTEKKVPHLGAEKGHPPAALGPAASSQPAPPWITVTRQKQRGARDLLLDQEDKPRSRALNSETGKPAKVPERPQESVKQLDFVRSKSFLITPAKPTGDRKQGTKLQLQEGLQRGISLSHQNLAAQSAVMTEKEMHQLKRASYASTEQPSWMELARKKSQAWSDMPQIIK